MTPDRLLRTAIIPALAELDIPDTIDARRMLVAIALQESGIVYRRQLTSSGDQAGPASSFWQFERGGGCRGVLAHISVRSRMKQICIDYNIEPTEQGLWEAMRYQDIVAAAAARLLLFTLPSKLASTSGEGWSQYIEAWRPGKPHPGTWSGHWATAERAVSAL